ncbi:MAG: NRDE family protein [Opitutaceae bacterium]|nr:NRDE family protein [Opitutaceae bacterium]
MSWRRDADGYELFFNRDELQSRAPESAPERHERDGVAFLAPRDGARGGTWLLVNERGVTVCLLNDYSCPWRPLEPRSRGEVVLACAAAASPEGVAAAVHAQPLGRVAPFHLVAIVPGASPLRLHWDGAGLAESRGATLSAPLSSSSFATAAVIAARVRRFSAYVREPAAPTSDELAAYHRQHDLRAGADSVLMRRPDAATRSISRVRVGPAQVCLDYDAVAWGAIGPVFTPTRHELPRCDRG